MYKIIAHKISYEVLITKLTIDHLFSADDTLQTEIAPRDVKRRHYVLVSD